jgi:hypothetical protein
MTDVVSSRYFAEFLRYGTQLTRCFTLSNANDIALVRKLRDENEAEIRGLGEEIDAMASRLGERKWALGQRKLARPMYADWIARLEAEK